MSETESHHSLKPGTRVDNYLIERRIGGGGFSLVYLAREADGGQQVVIKEYMPHKLACRDSDGLTIRPRDKQASDHFVHGQRLFLQEASTLAKIKHPNIVEVVSFFRANGTVYMVMTYEKGINLQDYIKRHNGNLSEKFIRTVFPPLLDGLKLLHSQGLLHLDIKPGNIYIRSGGNPVLLDFGAVHHMRQTRQYQTAQVITRGFAPVEQNLQGGYVGPWSDIYAIGATMRTCIDGNSPPAAEERRLEDPMKPAVAAFRKNYSRALLAAIDWAMEVDPLMRPQNVDELLEAMNKEDEPEPAPPSDSVLGRIASSLPWSRG